MDGRKRPAALVRPVLVLLILSVRSGPPCRAADPPAAAEESKPHIEIGFEERVRSENWSNLQDWSYDARDNVNQVRFRTKLWGRFRLGSHAEVMVLLNNESKKVTVPENPYKWDEVIFENLYLDWRFDDRWNVRVGRQNLMRGEGFVLFDGNAGDGSRTAYFNALDLTWNLGNQTRLEILAISDPRQDQYLPRFNDRHRVLTEWDERAAGVYLTSKAVASTEIEAYYLHKTEEDDPRSPESAAFQPNRRIHTLGARAVRTLPRGLTVAAEAAGQWGTQDPSDSIGAWGGYARVKKGFDHPKSPSVSLALIEMSGDDPATRRNEGWDPLFSRWPAWSELYIYSLAKEKGVAYWTNLRMLQAEFSFSPWKPLGFRATYYKMRAFHPFPGSASLFGGGLDRGDMIQLRADVRVGRGWKGHLLYERMAPGSFYLGGDRATFLRAEVTYAFKAAF